MLVAGALPYRLNARAISSSRSISARIRVTFSLEHAVEVDARVGARPPQVLHAEPDRRERILDLVRHLSRHLAPRQHALRARELGDVVQREHGAAAARAA